MYNSLSLSTIAGLLIINIEVKRNNRNGSVGRRI
jgi:hypothetical protein